MKTVPQTELTCYCRFGLILSEFLRCAVLSCFFLSYQSVAVISAACKPLPGNTVTTDEIKISDIYIYLYGGYMFTT